MISISDFKRLLLPVQNKIMLLIGRALLTAVNNSGVSQLISVSAMDGEQISDMERFQEYGLETYPLSGAEVLAGFINGNRDHGIAHKVHDRRYRPTDLAEGDVCLYTFENSDGSGCSIWLKNGRDIVIKGNGLTVTLDGDADVSVGGDATVSVKGDAAVDIGGDGEIETGGAFNVSASGSVEITAGGTLSLDGSIINIGDGAVRGAARFNDSVDPVSNKINSSSSKVFIL